MCCLLFCSWVVSALLTVLPLRLIALSGCLLQFAGMLLASFSVKYWQLVLTEGLLSGVGCGLLFSTAVCLIPTWFLKKRTIASGIMFGGTGLGGCVYSLISQAIIRKSGDQRWALRAVAIISLVLSLIATVFAQTRVSLRNQTEGRWYQKFLNAFLWPVQPKIWFSKISFLIIGFFCISCISYIIILYSLSNFVVSLGLSAEDGANAIAIWNAAQFVGRCLIGIAGDKIGRINISMLMSLLVIIFCFALWIPITTYGGVIAFSVIMGLFIGYQFVTISPIAADFFGAKNFPVIWCFISICNSMVGLTSGLMAFGLKRNNLSKPYLYAQIYTGLLFTVSFFFLLPLREIKVRNIMNSWRTELIESEKSEDSETTLTKYDRLLQPGLGSYIRRMVYKIVA